LKGKTRVTLAALAGVPFILVLGNSMLIPVLPQMKSALNISQFQVSLVITVFSFAAGLVIPFAGFLSDRISRKMIIVPSLILYGIGGIVALIGILVLNNNLENNTLTILIVLGLVAMTASAFGTIIGSVSKDMKSVTTFTQSIMILLYAPAILNLFPKVPGFIQKLFPTYYLFSPLLKLSEGSFVLSADGWEIIVLMLLLISLQLLLVSKKL